MTAKSTLASASIVCAALTAACGSSDDGTGESPMMETEDETEPTEPMLPNDVLSGTNGTMPCNPGPDTEFPGDELCVLPVEAGTGAYFHAGPDDYDDPDQIAEFTLEAGGEVTGYYVVESNNDETVWFRNQHYRMRPGSHHLIMYTLGAEPPGLGWVPEDQLDMAGPIGGTQVFAMDFPEDGLVAPEDENLARPLAPRTKLAFEMHYVNPGEEPILREAWVNLLNNDVPPEDRVILGAPFLIGYMRVPPHTTQVLNYKKEIPYGDSGGTPTNIDMRIVSLFGHRHASTTRFSIWLNRDGARELVYEDYNWAEARELFYNSLIMNPSPDPATASAGGASGQLLVKSGDVLEWECQVKNTLDVDLVFGNGVYEKEMCNVFGTLTSTGPIILFDSVPPEVTTL